jgi:hypothetical protein
MTELSAELCPTTRGKFKIGDPASILYSEKKKAGYYDNPLTKVRRAASQKRYALTEHGQLVINLVQEAFKARQRELRQSMCGSHTLQSFHNNATAKQMAHALMHDPWTSSEV